MELIKQGKVSNNYFIMDGDKLLLMRGIIGNFSKIYKLFTMANLTSINAVRTGFGNTLNIMYK